MNKDFRLERKIAYLNRGDSKVFENWQKYGLITKEEFEEALRWVCEDPLTEDGKLTREIGLHVTHDMENKLLSERMDGGAKFAMPFNENSLKGKIIKLKRVYDKNKNFIGFYNINNNKVWTGNGRRKISLSAMDSI